MPHAAWVVGLLGLCLLGTAAAAQPAEVATRPVEPLAHDVPSAYEVRVHPGQLTVVFFDAPLDVQAVKQELRRLKAQFEWTDVGEQSVVLIPSAALRAGERAALPVAYVADGAAPARAELALVSHPSQADPQVRVYRRPRTAAALEEELATTRAELAAVRAELRTLRTQGAPLSLAGLVRAGLLADGHILRVRVHPKHRPSLGSVLEARFREAWMSTAPGRIAVEVTLADQEEHPGWTPGHAVLKGPTGAEEQVLAMDTQRITDRQGMALQQVVVEATLPAVRAGGPFTLELYGADGTLALQLSNLSVAAP